MVPAPAQAPAPPREKNCVGKANKAKIQAYIVLLRLRYDIYAKWKDTGIWPDDSEVNKAIEGHSTYWTEQLKSGRAITAGAMNGDYWDNAAIIVFEAASPEEAETVMKNDPAVKSPRLSGPGAPIRCALGDQQISTEDRSVLGSSDSSTKVTRPALRTQLLPDTATRAKSGVESHRCQSPPARTRIGRQTNRRNSNEIRLEDRLMLRVYSPL